MCDLDGESSPKECPSPQGRIADAIYWRRKRVAIALECPGGVLAVDERAFPVGKRARPQPST